MAGSAFLVLSRAAQFETLAGMSSSASDVRVYHISIWRYLVMWWFLGPFLLMGLTIAVFSEPNTRGAGIILMLMMLPFLLGWHWLARRMKLTVSRQGLRTSEVGGAIEVPWTGIVGFRGTRGHEGFVTAEPLTGKGAENLVNNASDFAGFDAEDQRLVAERRFLPMRAFAFHLRRGDLRRLIVEYAPHLQEPLKALDAPPPPRPEPTPAETRRNRIIVAIVVAAFAWGFVLIWKGERWHAWFFTVTYGLLDPIFAIASGAAAWIYLRRKQWVMGVLSFLMMLVMFGWTLKNWVQFGQLLHGGSQP